MSESKHSECVCLIDKMYEKYKTDEYMLQRIYNHICIHLPNTLVNEHKNREKRQNLNSHLFEEQQIFMQIFLSKNNYYYLPNNNLYYEYNGMNYLIVKEDEIIHKLLSAISKDKILMQWKYKTKATIIKQIKDRNLFTSIPESDTIQNVLNALYPYYFSSKDAVKYFLTTIGDNILKKNLDLIFLVSSNMCKFLDELSVVSMSSIGHTGVAYKFVSKYHENHSFANCRLMSFNEHYSNDYWRETLKKIGLNLICVATHYSNRYHNSDNFLNTQSDDTLIKYVYALKNTTPNDLMDKFIDTFFENANSDLKVEWKNLHFIWKLFLSNNNYPNVVFSNNLKNYFKSKYTYDEATDSFIGITSKYLPVYKDFIQFWNTTIINSTSQDFENEIEIDEISSLFKLWTKNKSALSEETIIKIIKHFFQSEIIEEKYILNVTSKLWDKFNDIEKSIKYIKENFDTNYNLSLISFDDLYKYYQNYCNDNLFNFIVSKRYFEKYLYHNFVEFIVHEKFIKTEWIKS